MHFSTILFISIGLAMDAFAVSVAQGLILKEKNYVNALKFGISFGLFQMIMPLIGWRIGFVFAKHIQSYDHWIAFALLFLIGAKMIYESGKIKEIEKEIGFVSLKTLLVLSIATSVDALAVGVSFACLGVSIIIPSVVIGVVTFIMSYFGLLLGSRFGSMFENKVETAGGIILIIIGAKILIEHVLV